MHAFNRQTSFGREDNMARGCRVCVVSVCGRTGHLLQWYRMPESGNSMAPHGSAAHLWPGIRLATPFGQIRERGRRPGSRGARRRLERYRRPQSQFHSTSTSCFDLSESQVGACQQKEGSNGVACSLIWPAHSREKAKERKGETLTSHRSWTWKLPKVERGL